jgi:hypothetical protein
MKPVTTLPAAALPFSLQQAPFKGFAFRAIRAVAALLALAALAALAAVNNVLALPSGHAARCSS